jgi:hypothetical protein
MSATWRRRAAVAKVAVAGGLTSVLTLTVGQVPAGPAAADASCPKYIKLDIGLEQFYMSDGLTRYQDLVQQYIARLDEHHVNYRPEDIKVYQVPTSDGLTRYITHNANIYQVYWNWTGAPYDPDAGATATVPGECPDPVTAGVLTPAVTTLDKERFYEVVPLATAATPNLNNIMVNYTGVLQEEQPPPSWTVAHKDCQFVGTEYFERWVCWRLDAQNNDNDSDHSYWQLHVDVTGHSMKRKFERMWVETVPAPRNDRYQYFDATPVPNSAFGGSSGCETHGTQISIESGSPVSIGFAWYWERTTCETYYPKTYGSEGGHWASIWSGNPLAYPNAQRYVMIKVPVRTSWDRGAAWELWTGQRTRY